jgi:F-type H+-transporting ATPase subunit gamma
MATLRDIKSRIAGVSSIEKITSAMKMVSSMKSRRAQKQAQAARPYYQKIADVLGVLLASEGGESFNHPLLSATEDTISNVVIIVIAGDKGMCGGFNTNLFKYVDTYLEGEFKQKYADATPHLILVGNKPIEYFRKKHYDIIGKYPNAFQHLDFTMVDDMRKLFVDDFVKGGVNKVEIFFNKFVNVMHQEPMNMQVLPIELKSTDSEDNNVDYIFEPNKEEIFGILLSQYMDLSIWQPILESNAAEQAARLMAMDKATQNANDLIKDLSLEYNNARQAAITTEMLEIVSGADALKQ